MGQEADAGLWNVEGRGFDDGLMHSLDVGLEAIAEVLKFNDTIMLSWLEGYSAVQQSILLL